MGYTINVTLKSSASPSEIESTIKSLISRATGMQANVRLTVTNPGGANQRNKDHGNMIKQMSDRTNARI